MAKSLEDIGKQYGTDKVTHRYLPYYEQRFQPLRNCPVSLLEIGVLNGASLRMWNEFFPHSVIYGVDNDPSSLINEERIHCFTGSQNDVLFLESVVAVAGKFDVIIDDGSHIGTDQLASFTTLLPYLVRGGWYCIEDCHLLFNPHYTARSDNTILSYIDKQRKAIFRGHSTISEVTMVGHGRHDGLLLIRKR